MATNVLAPPEHRTAASHGPSMSIIPEADGAYYVGLVGMVDRPMTVYGVWPRATVPTEVLVCSPVPGAVPFMTVEAAHVGDHCERLDPIRAGTRLLPNPPEGNAEEYLVVHVAESGPGIASFCGLRVLHRVGIRLAYTNNAGGVNVVWNASSELEPDEDPCLR